jgi:hypothetical protein
VACSAIGHNPPSESQRPEYTAHSSTAESQTDGTPARTALLGDDTSRLSNACRKGISNFVRCIRSLVLLGRPGTRGRLDKD